MSTITNIRKAGDRVSIDDPKFPGVWIVKSIGPKNTVVVPEAGGRGLRAPHYLVIDPVASDSSVKVEAIPFVSYDAGEVVVINGYGGKYAGQHFVVLVDKGEKINVAKLGGDSGRYLRVVRSSLAKVELADIVK